MSDYERQITVKEADNDEIIEEAIELAFSDHEEAIEEAGGVRRGELLAQIAAAYTGTEGPLERDDFEERDRGRGRWYSP